MTETERTRGIFIGRFQPFHLGHLEAVEQMNKDPDIEEIIIGIGGSQYKNLVDNPFSSVERKRMIKASLNLEKPYKLINIPDISNFPKWVSHVERLTPKFQFVFTGNADVRTLFEQKGYQIKDTQGTQLLSATEIRHLMIMDRDFEHLIPEPVAKIIDDIGGTERIKRKYLRMINPCLVTDLIINYRNAGLILIKRKYPPFKGMWALPGGHLETGFETVEECAAREGFEETGFRFDPQDILLEKVYSKPQRDPRNTNVGIVYSAFTDSGTPVAADDALDAKIFPFKKIPTRLAFNHREIIDNYFSSHNIALI